MAAFNKELNKNNANIRNNSDEFSNCMLFLKEFKIGVRSQLTILNDGSVHGRLMKLFMQIKKLDTFSRPGFATVINGLKTDKGKVLFRNFVFNRYARLCTQLGNPVLNFEQFTVSWNSLDPSFLKFPPLATHCELHFLLLVYDVEKALFTTYESNFHRFAKTDPSFNLSMATKTSVDFKPGMPLIIVGDMKFIEVWHDAEYSCDGKAGFGMEVLGVKL